MVIDQNANKKTIQKDKDSLENIEYVYHMIIILRLQPKQSH